MKGAVLNSLGRLFVRGVSLLNLIALTRLLSPADYGVAALAMATIGIIQAVSDVRVNAALVMMRELDERDVFTAFTITLLRGLLIAAILLGGAELFAAFSRSPELAAPLRVLAIVPIFDGLRNPRFMLFERNIDFSRAFRRTLLSVGISAAVLIASAVILRSYWAIVIATLVQRGLESALTYWGVPGRLGLSLQSWRVFLRFGGWLTFAGTLDQLRTYIGPSAIISRFLGQAALGLFSIADNISYVVTHDLAQPLANAVAPGLATIADHRDRLRQAYRDAQRTLFGVMFPMAVGMAVTSRDALVLLAGAKWEGAAPLVTILAPALGLSVLNAGASALAMALGHARLLFTRNLLAAVVSLPLVWFVTQRGSLAGSALAMSAGVLFETAIALRIATTLIGLPWLQPILDSWRTFLACALMVAVELAIGPSRQTAALPLAIELAPKVLLGALTYVVAILALWRLAGRPDGFEPKLLDNLASRVPIVLKPAWRWVRGR
ncbi:MAG: lipopolysaccharide biosynthesis protein [Sphingomonadaceae bacterium]|nr:lipopolysaccharide biosynthesis protein [Sphingomonadaceae bacterium]